MNKNNILYGILAIVVVGGIFWYTLSQTSSYTATNTQGTIPTSTNGTDNTSTGNTSTHTSPKTIGSLLAVTSPQSCTFSDNTAGNTIQGTMLIANGKLRSDYSTNINGKITYTHIIINGAYNYMWQDGQTTGTKTIQTAGVTTISQNIDLQNFDNFACTNSVTTQADFTKFNLPTTIKFILTQ